MRCSSLFMQPLRDAHHRIIERNVWASVLYKVLCLSAIFSVALSACFIFGFKNPVHRTDEAFCGSVGLGRPQDGATFNPPSVFMHAAISTSCSDDLLAPFGFAWKARQLIIVTPHVLSVGFNQNKILNSIIVAFPVYVMNHFAGIEESLDVALHHEPVFQYFSTRLCSWMVDRCLHENVSSMGLNATSLERWSSLWVYPYIRITTSFAAHSLNRLSAIDAMIHTLSNNTYCHGDQSI